MSVPFNESEPCALGVEWFVESKALQPIASDTAPNFATEVRVSSTQAETVDRLWWFTHREARGRYEVEVYEDGSFSGGASQTDTYRPTLDVNDVDGWGWSEGGGLSDVDLYAQVDGAAFTPGTYNGRAVQDDSWLSPLFGQAMEATFRTSGIAGDFTNRRIVSVTVEARVDLLVDYYLVAAGSVTPLLVIDGVRYLGNTVTVSGERSGGTRVATSWRYNPATGCSWRETDLDEFDDYSGTWAFGWVLGATGSSNNLVVLYQGWLDVLSEADDPRVALGCVDRMTPGWNSVDLEEPDGTPGWPKANGTDYIVSIRARDPYIGFDPLVPILADPRQPCPSPVEGVEPAYNRRTRMLDRIDETTLACPALLLEDSYGAVSTDSQPYTLLGDDPVDQLGWDTDLTRVYASHDIEQDVTTPADTYSWLRCLVCTESTDTADDLTVGIYDRATDTLQGSVTFTVDDLAWPRTAWQIMEDTPGLLALGAAQHYLRFSCPAASGLGWRVQAISCYPEAAADGPPPAGTEAVTWGGTTDTLWVDGAQHTHADACATIHTAPDTPAGFTAAAAGEVDCVDWIELAWTPTSVNDCGLGFLRYEIDRSDDAGATWQRIADITDEAVASFDDYESLRNTAARYRMRVRRVDGAPSAWTATQTATAAMTCCGYVLTSNEEPDLTVWYDDLRPRRYEFLENATELQLHGRDYQVQFRELEDRGDRFQVELLVAAEGGVGGTVAASPEGRRVFDPLLVLAGNKRDRDTGEKVSVSYVCVHDSDGNRWFASLRTPTGVRTEPGGQYVLDVVVVEVTDVPSVADPAAAGS